MADFPSTNVRLNSQVSPYTDTQTFPLFDTVHGKGGLRTVGTTAEMNAIFDERRVRGMMVYVSGVSAYYALVGTTANSGWTTEFQMGTGTNILPLNNTFTGTNIFSSGVTFASTTDHTGNARFVGGINVTSSIGITSSGPVTVTHNITQTGPTRGISAEGFLYVGGGATFNTSVATPTVISAGATLTIQSGVYGVGTARNIRLLPYGQLILEPSLVTAGLGGSTTKVVITNTDDAQGQTQITGGDLYLGTKTDSAASNSPVNIILANPTTAFTTTLTAPNTATSSKTITLPNATGTVALDANANTFTALQTFTAGITASSIYVSSGSTFAGRVQFNGGLTASTIDVSGAIRTTGNANIGGDLTVTGNLQINGTTTTINSTTLQIDDKLIELAHSPSGATGNDAAVDGGGIQLNSTQGNKTFTWVDSTDSWTSNQGIDVTSGNVYKVGGTTVLSSNTLGSGIVSSSLTSVGTIATGVWQGTAVGATYGGTGRTTYTIGDVLYANGTSSLTVLGASTAGRLLSSTGAGAAPEYKQLLIRDADANSIASESTGTGTLILTVQNASNSLKGVAKFDSEMFTVTTGNVSLSKVDGGTY